MLHTNRLDAASSVSNRRVVPPTAITPQTVRCSAPWRPCRPALSPQAAAAAAPAALAEHNTHSSPHHIVTAGHTGLLHGLGDVGDIAPAHMPWVLRIAHVSAHTTGGDSQAAMAEISRGLSAWKASINRGLLPDDEAILQLKRNNEGFTVGHSVNELAWPPEPLRTTLLRGLGKLGVARFAQKYPAVQVGTPALPAMGMCRHPPHTLVAARQLTTAACHPCAPAYCCDSKHVRSLSWQLSLQHEHAHKLQDGILQ